MPATPLQRAVRPIVFDGVHVHPTIRSFGSRRSVVVDGRAGARSLTLALANTPEVRRLLLHWLAEAETAPEDVLVISARVTADGRRRLVVELGTR